MNFRKNDEIYKNLPSSHWFYNSLAYNENPFNALYFIDNLSGALLVSKKFSNKSKICDTDEDLISSFLNAMNLFINELNNRAKSSEEIQEINFKDTRILYERKERLLVIGITNKTDIFTERRILHNILLDFYDRFEVKINKFNGVIDPEFMGYAKKLKEIKLNSFNNFRI
ncbi:MAG: hypothetical protein P8Y70_19735 [Candidatus Lokiarchaeota archaeon]